MEIIRARSDVIMTNDHTDGNDDRKKGFDFGTAVDFLADFLDELTAVEVRHSSEPVAGRARNSGVEVSGHRARESDMTADDWLLDTHFEDDTFVVLADIPGTSLEELTVGIHPRETTLVIARNDTVLERVPLPASPTSPPDALFNNGVLEVRLDSAHS